MFKPSMVVPGKAAQRQANPEEIAEKTLAQLRRSVPAAMPGINFLSGGQTSEEATVNLNAMNVMAGNAPWQLSFLWTGIAATGAASVAGKTGKYQGSTKCAL